VKRRELRLAAADPKNKKRRKRKISLLHNNISQRIPQRMVFPIELEGSRRLETTG
jgi:hypothetical protein